MSTLTKLPNAQTVLSAVFDFSYNDEMDNTAGDTVALGALTAAGNTVWDIFTPPPNAVVIGGRVIVHTAFNSTANTIYIGDSDDTNRYTETAPINLQDPDAPTTGFDLLGDGKVYAGNQAVRITLSNTVAAATAGRALVVVNFVVLNRATENLKTT